MLEEPALLNLSPKVAALAKLLREKARVETSSRNRLGTQKLVAASLTDPALRSRLRACSRQVPCWLSCCPICARRKGVRYYTQTFEKSVSHLPQSKMRWVTVNVCETSILTCPDFVGAHHRALREIVKRARASCQTKTQVWGTREVEPRLQPDGSIHWLWHWHLLVYLDTLPEDELVDALRQQWPGTRAVRCDPVRGKTEAAYQASLRNIASYPIKARFTVLRPDGLREWLPESTIDELACWMIARGWRWPRFAIGNRASS